MLLGLFLFSYVRSCYQVFSMWHIILFAYLFIKFLAWLLEHLAWTNRNCWGLVLSLWVLNPFPCISLRTTTHTYLRKDHFAELNTKLFTFFKNLSRFMNLFAYNPISFSCVIFLNLHIQNCVVTFILFMVDYLFCALY